LYLCLCVCERGGRRVCDEGVIIPSSISFVWLIHVQHNSSACGTYFIMESSWLKLFINIHQRDLTLTCTVTSNDVVIHWMRLVQWFECPSFNEWRHHEWRHQTSNDVLIHWMMSSFIEWGILLSPMTIRSPSVNDIRDHHQAQRNSSFNESLTNDIIWRDRDLHRDFEWLQRLRGIPLSLCYWNKSVCMIYNIQHSMYK